MDNKISEERINQFLSGRNPMERVVAIECGYQDSLVSVIQKTPEGKKVTRQFEFMPFIWAKQSGARKLYFDKKTGKQDTALLKRKMSEYGIQAVGLNIFSEDGKTTERLENGYRVLFKATRKCSYSRFLMFFKAGGVDVYGKNREFIAITPVEQYMMRSGVRLFKGFEDYDELTRLEFDLETQGLNPKTDSIDQIGIRTNKGFEIILPIEGDTEEEKEESELEAIEDFFKIISQLNPDVITGHNSENFDWQFLITRCEVLGTSIKEITEKYFKQALYKKSKPTVLKLGGEMEYFNQTILWGYNITDSLHAVRRAQAIDSNMKEANLKYVTKYSKLNKENRVYVQGDMIKKTYHSMSDFALNDKNGNWYQIDDKHPLKDGYESVSGRYIVERYLLDDLYETDKVELRYNQPNFLLSKILPTTFSKVCTMGTAGTWKLLMMAWSYENNLAIPDYSDSGAFTGGLSRLMKVGFVERIVKLDYNSLYPSIDITWDVKPQLDVSNVMLSLLGYILDKREEYKDNKGLAKKNKERCKEELSLLEPGSEKYIEKQNEIKHWTFEENSNDKKQLPFKIFANSFFGSFGAPNIFPWGDLKCAEKTTCVGRQSLRLMTHWFKQRGYEPIVGDSFLYDTPIYIKYKDNGLIDIKTISEAFDKEKCDVDLLGREYDCSEKPYFVLCRGGWVDVKYVYRHKTDKDIHRVVFGDGLIDVTSDHSLFDENKCKLHSKNVTPNETKLEMSIFNVKDITNNKYGYSKNESIKMGEELAISEDENKRVPIEIINSNNSTRKWFLEGFMGKISKTKLDDNNKLLKSGINFLMQN